MVLPQTRYYSLMAALITLCLTQETFATKRSIDEIENPEERHSKRQTLPGGIDTSKTSDVLSLSMKTLSASSFSEEDGEILETREIEPTFEEKLRSEYKEKWGRLYKPGLERRKAFLKSNQSFQQCDTTISRLEWVLTHQNNIIFQAPLPMRNNTFLSELLGIDKAVCSTLTHKLRKENRISEEEAAFFTSITATKLALQDVKAALDDKKSYKEIIVIMAKTGVLKVSNSQSWLLRDLAMYARRKNYKDILSRDDFQYLKQGKTAHVHKDGELPVMEQIIEHIENLATRGAMPFQYLASKEDNSNTLFGDFIENYHTFLHRDFSPTTYRGYVKDLYKSNDISLAAKQFIKDCTGPSPDH